MDAKSVLKLGGWLAQAPPVKDVPRNHGTQPVELESLASTPALSIVVPVRNGARELQLCLEGLFRAGAMPDAVVVVDDASTDDTATVAARSGVRVVRRMRRGGPAAARNDGVRLTNADLVLFVDADVVVTSDALARVRQTFRREPDVAAVFGCYDDAPAAAGVVSRYRNLLHHFVHQQARAEASTFWAGCGAVRRQAFDAVGGYNEAGRLNYIEDIEFGGRLRRAGYRVRLDAGLLAKHLKRWTLRAMVRTDLLYRALPWSRLMLTSSGLIDDLNVSRRQRLSVTLTGSGGLAVLLAPVEPTLLVLAGFAVLGVAVVNARLFMFLRTTGGSAFAAACLPLHLVHYACGGLGFALAWLETRILAAARRAGRAPGEELVEEPGPGGRPQGSLSAREE